MTPPHPLNKLFLGLFVLAIASMSNAQLSPDGASQRPSPVDGYQSKWLMPIAGLSDDPQVSWGVNVTRVIPDENVPNPFTYALQPITFGQQSSPNDTVLNATQLIYPSGVNYPDDLHGPRRWLSAMNDSLVVGSRANFTLSTWASIDAEPRNAWVNYSYPTVPFGLNLGKANVWDGSVVFGGYYDSNRIDGKDGMWHKMPASNNTDFLTIGRQTYPFFGIGSAKPQNVILDFNSDSIVLTPGAQTGIHCGHPLTISIADTNATWTIDSSLIQAPHRCSEVATSSIPDGTVVLGKPFFQALYTYADKNGSIYFTKANNYSLAPDPVVFFTWTGPTPAQVPYSAIVSSKPTSGARSLSMQSATGVIGLACILLALGLL